MNWIRALRHLAAPSWLTRRAFPLATLDAIEAAVAAAELQHAGELRFVVEAGLPWPTLFHDLTARQRAQEVFSQLRVWDTEHNSGVLIYVQLIDRRVEIVADRGINAQVAQVSWDAICRSMEAAFRIGEYRHGALEAIRRVGALLGKSYPRQVELNTSENNVLDDFSNVKNELPDRPVLL